ncbi:hypothetical protein [Candidatus Odyssella thessalonicensis]|uniref:hypothetical protein n=1 Tax=Candidatus Odyssella thessalonicensis TaxID=84647 RepID=UPI000225ABBE|nr:hypothetical protein [Candidatus Odyssella thessalonicensis]
MKALIFSLTLLAASAPATETLDSAMIADELELLELEQSLTSSSDLFPTTADEEFDPELMKELEQLAQTADLESHEQETVKQIDINDEDALNAEIKALERQIAQEAKNASYLDAFLKQHQDTVNAIKVKIPAAEASATPSYWELAHSWWTQWWGK